MPIPLFTTEKPSNSEAAQSPSQAALASETSQCTDAVSGDTTTATSTREPGRRSSAERTRKGEEEAADRAYLERMEEEYAKREGGA
ncbi:unnamed protein product [Tuber melanosporum]|uniref:(Perigord truffle) hypothetical protein n=1 Tax=Tuber melanosporum (strain Mel28) TaxID=656061 RepID=D5G7J6_TUBMM|nr:uncharacterized protein GSTUM_00002604001 [Tuber melanosporum]CAZ80489.1 unnamed protein product [Tuber melanosporum]